MDLFKIEAIGRLGRQPETKTLDSGVQVTRLSIAVNTRDRNKEKKTYWIRANCYGKLASLAMDWLSKGMPVYVCGKGDIAKSDSEAGYSISLNADMLIPLGSGRKNGEQEATDLEGNGGGSPPDDIPF